MCCGADDDIMFQSKEKANSYNSARLQYTALEADWADAFAHLEPCVEKFDTEISTPNGISNLFTAWEKAFNELLQAGSNVELLHHYAQLQRMTAGLQMAANTALWTQYQLYQSDAAQFLAAPDGVTEAVEGLRRSLNGESTLVGRIAS